MSIETLELMKTRLEYRGGIDQQSRMIKDKRNSLDRALLYSYQAAKISKLNSQTVIKALINPNKLSADYDEKIISVGFEHEFAAGDIFTWNNTGTKWIIYLQDLTELAYFRGNIRKCNYQLKWKDEDGNIQSSYGAIIGPKESKISSSIRYGISVDSPNYTLQIIFPKTEASLKYFKRYQKFYLTGLEDTQPVCWRIEAIDSISTPGIMEISAKEYYINEDKDDVENGVVDGLVVDPIPPEPSDVQIVGEVFIKPKKTYTYTYTGTDEGTWIFDSSLPLEYTIDGTSIQLKWLKTYTGQFTLAYGTHEKVIVVESLF